MAVVSVNIVRQTSRQDTRGRSESVLYRVLCDSASDTVVTARTASGVPVLGEPYDGNLFVVCSSIDARPTSDSSPLLAFDVQAEFSSRSLTPDEPTEDPLDKVPDVEWSSVKGSEPFNRDMDGQDVLNSAGQPFDRQPEREVHDRQCTVTVRVADYNDDDYEPLIDTTNDADCLGKAAGTVKLSDVQARRLYELGQYFWEVTLTLLVRKTGWALRLVDQGYEWDDEGELIAFVDRNGSPVLRLLDGDGLELPAGNEAVLLEFTQYESADLTGLLSSLGVS